MSLGSKLFERYILFTSPVAKSRPLSDDFTRKSTITQGFVNYYYKLSYITGMNLQIVSN